jgi:hypothetical protein
MLSLINSQFLCAKIILWCNPSRKTHLKLHNKGLFLSYRQSYRKKLTLIRSLMLSKELAHQCKICAAPGNDLVERAVAKFQDSIWQPCAFRRTSRITTALIQSKIVSLCSAFRMQVLQKTFFTQTLSQDSHRCINRRNDQALIKTASWYLKKL